MELSRELFCILVSLFSHLTVSFGLSPIIIVPGFRGSQLEAKITDGSVCDTNGAWELYWINLLKPPSCINKVFTMLYDNETNIYSNLEGIEVRVPGFGGTESIEYLDANKQVPYFNTFVEYFVANGYERGKSICGAPYDWRLAPDMLQEQGYYRILQQLVEEMMQANNGSKVTLVSHSVGGPVILYFLNRYVTQEWKDQHINAFIPLSSAWTGGNDGLLLFLSEINILDNAYLTLFTSSYRTSSSAAWQLPNPHAWNNTALIITPDKNYSANTFSEMFSEIEREDDYERFRLALSINGDYPPPNVPLYCYYGVNVSTAVAFIYGSGFPNDFQNTTCGDGDGIISIVTSEVCLRWSGQEAYFESKAFPLGHGEMISSNDTLKLILRAVTPTPSPTPTPNAAVSLLKINNYCLIIACLLIFGLYCI